MSGAVGGDRLTEGAEAEGEVAAVVAGSSAVVAPSDLAPALSLSDAMAGLGWAGDRGWLTE